MDTACPRCGTHSLGRNFCDDCGLELGKSCAFCSAANRPSARFCATCGKPFSAAPETQSADIFGPQQKYITILFADICGSTKTISNLDPEESADVLGQVLAVIATAVRRFGGVINQRMGDGFMVLFGAPVSAEDHAARACFAALAARDAVAQMGARALPVRFGISSGPVVVRRAGRDEEDYEVAGVTAHIAARLEHQAEPWTILLSEQTVKLVTGIAKVGFGGTLSLKGLSSPQPVYLLHEAIEKSSWSVRSGLAALSTFVGRHGELIRLAGALDAVGRGHSQAIAIVGDPGSGKSRLVHEFVGTLAKDAWQVMRIETTQQSSAVPYLLVSRLLRAIVGCSEDEPISSVAARLPLVVTSMGLDDQFDMTPLLIHLGQDVDELLLDVSNPTWRRHRLLRALRPILLRYVELNPLVLIIEDYHWLDASSIDLLTDLLEGMRATRLLSMVTTRPERRPGWRQETAETSRWFEIELKPLTHVQADGLLQELIGGSDRLKPLRDHIVTRADGTPFFLEEFARSLIESGVVTQDPVSVADIVIPASVQSILAARIDRLSPLHKRILQIAAVIGRAVPSALLAAVAELDEAFLTQQIAGLRTANFMIEETLPSGVVHSFSHALTQAVAYDSLLRSERRALHGRTLRALEAESSDDRDDAVEHIVHHAVRAEAWLEAARYALVAGERATRRSALMEAKSYLETTIAAVGRLPPSIPVVTLGIDARLRLRGVLGTMGDVAGTQQSLREAVAMAEEAGDRITLARVYIGHGAWLSHWGDLPGAIQLSQTALDIMLAANDEVGIVGAAFALAQAQWYAGDLADARALLLATAPHARSENAQRRSVATVVLPAAVFFCYLARTHADTGNRTAGFAAIREARTIAYHHGQAFEQVLVDLYEGGLLFDDGKITASVDMLERALAVANSNHIERHIPSVACSLGRAYLDVGRADEAAGLLRRAIKMADRNGLLAKRFICSPPLVRALAEGEGRRFAEAKELAINTIREATAKGFRPVVAQTKMALARVLRLSGAQDVAQATAREAIALCQELGFRQGEAEARETLAWLSQPDPRAVPCRLRSAVDGSVVRAVG
jgi:class 3 adenylate cyclase/tetratricopeptide (TPR) repeat protein